MKTYWITSPSGNLSLFFFLENGRLYYQMMNGKQPVSEFAPIGIRLENEDLSEGLAFVDCVYGEINERYRIPAFKKAECVNHCTTMLLTLSKGEHILKAEGRAFDDGAAFRLILEGEGPCEVDCETSAFALPESVEQVYATKWMNCYEDHYHPVPVEDIYQNCYSFPLLFHLSGSIWAVYAEAAVFGNFGGSVLGSSQDEPRMLYVKKALDKLDAIHGTYPQTTPWRVIMCGTLDEITSSNILENLNPESIVEDPSFIRPGLVAWSWSAEHSSPRDPKRMHDYVDFAANMGWPYSLVDGGWPGVIDIPELVQYAAEKNVKIWVWEHSQRMRDPEEVDEKMALWSSWGVVGIKIDFFESDAQERVAQFGMLAEHAAKHRMMLNFHGCCKPAGYSRVWPHILSYEGVMGGEYLANFSTFLPGGPDAAHNCTLPFTRNLMGPMDYTPICYETYLTGTTDAHQTALPVIFLSYIMHCGEGKEIVERNPAAPFLKKLHSTWDEGILLEGSPANYVTMARRHGSEWFVGGICARRPRNAVFSLNFLDEGAYEAELYADDLSDLRPTDAAIGALGEMTPEIVAKLEAMTQRPSQHKHDVHLMKVSKCTLTREDTLNIPENVNGGFALYMKKK